MIAKHHNFLTGVFKRLCKRKPKDKPSVFVETRVHFNEPDCHGPFSFRGREYSREVVDNWGNEDVLDQVVVWGTRTGKTRSLYGGLCWVVEHKSVRCLYVKPKSKGTAGAEDDARTRFIPMLRATIAAAHGKLQMQIPRGSERHNFKTSQQMINGCVLDWTGSNSVSSLASNPCGVVIQDEVDKFNTTRKRDSDGSVVEADASSLADERTKDAQGFLKRFKASTPTLPTGLIWIEFLKSDQRQRFVPCPHCDKEIIFAWSSEFYTLPKVATGGPFVRRPLPLSYVKWDQTAKQENGDWNYSLVEKTAHIECCHCHAKILDGEKTAMDAKGLWRATAHGSPKYRGYHLPSLYSTLPECSFGKMAVRFLKACKSLDGPRGFINSDLAMPYAAQDIATRRTDAVSHVEVTAEWKKIMSVDCQQKAPYFWYIIRAWGGNECVGLKGGQLDSWDDVEAAQRSEKVIDEGVILDSGFGAKDDAEVYRNCAAHGQLIQDPHTRRLGHLGWMPSKGQSGRRRWRNAQSNLYLPYRYVPIDPYMGTSNAGKVQMDLFEFAGDFFKDILATLRQNRKEIDYKWSISPELDTDEYREHMRGQHKIERVKYGMVILEWVKRHRRAPDHMFACEVLNLALSNALGFVNLEATPKAAEPVLRDYEGQTGRLPNAK